MEKRIRRNEQIYRCGFEQHIDGKFVIGLKRYRPFWPRGMTRDCSEEELNIFIGKAVEAMKDFYEKCGLHPKEIEAKRFSDGSIEVDIRRPSEELYYFC